jgi:hypothetical protein
MNKNSPHKLRPFGHSYTLLISQPIKMGWKKSDPRNHTKHHEKFLCVGSCNFVDPFVSSGSESSMLLPKLAELELSIQGC